MRNVSRRAILGRTLGVASGILLSHTLLTTQANAKPKPPAPNLSEEAKRALAHQRRVQSGQRSANGWEMENLADDHGSIYTRPVPGTAVHGIQVRMGEIEWLLVHVIRRYNYEVDELRDGDVTGWRAPAAVRKHLAESNLASGTAVQIRSGSYPSGMSGGLFPLQRAAVHRIVKDLNGVVRWGGDDHHADESLFYIALPPGDGQLKKEAGKVFDEHYEPSRGAGVPSGGA
ncbi:hypothetical protein [Streptomyces caatingaensis]|uniref:Uncharacterized protein n=1 Tax=Streptomyces caatingaensis TaxID=1678637 RepID=A0A0K9XA12_9ACTN|nr:hypothetical protein [Streptomyces caatingaensis]KNB49941.1 hypothetical protein AC230_24740 [Streptomyces caatingaensis]